MKKPVPPNPKKTKMRFGAPVKKFAGGGMFNNGGQGGGGINPNAIPVKRSPMANIGSKNSGGLKDYAGPPDASMRVKRSPMANIGSRNSGGLKDYAGPPDASMRVNRPNPFKLPVRKKPAPAPADTPDTGGEAPAYRRGGKVAPWDKPRPAGLGKSKPMSAGQKASAKAAAKKAGRPYPNLVDNMKASKK